jgi:hypothetical protein
MGNTVAEARRRLAVNTKYSYTTVFFVRNQLKNISPIFWLIQFLCFAYMIWNIPSKGSIDEVRTLFATVVPILTIYMLPELYKAQVSGAAEIEAVCAHSPAKIVASKLLIISCSNFIIIALTSLFWGNYHQLEIFPVLCQGLLPFNIAIIISLVIFDFVKLKSPYGMIVSAVTIAFVLVRFQYFGKWLFSYWVITFPVSVAMFLALACMALYKTNRIKEWYYGA